MKTKWIFLIVCVVVLVTAAISIRMNAQADASSPANHPGPYKVGFVANTYYDSTRSDFAGGPRPIQTFIWYPAASDNNGDPMPPAVYPVINLAGSMVFPDATSTNYEAYGIDPAYQEVDASKAGPFPLVVFSPGQGASSTLYIQIGARLASHGFVVAIPTNYDDKMTVTGEPQFYASQESYTLGIYIERTRDLQYLMTHLVEESQQSGNQLSGTIRSDQIAVSGHSVGGGAALALAGGDDQVCDIAGVDPSMFPPETCVTIVPDPRIKAVVTIDGSNWFLHYAELARIKIPNMGIGREWNTLKSASPGFEHDQARQHAAIQSSPSYRVDVAHANHMSFANVCAINQVLHDQGVLDDATLDQIVKMACPSEPVSEEDIGSLTSQYMIAFLKTVLVGETGYQEMLTTDYALANEPFIEFFETEKGSSNPRDEDAYFSYFIHQPGALQAKALKDPSP